MRNYSRIAFFVISAIFLFTLIGFASAAHPYNTYTYTDRDLFSYHESNTGFRISNDDSNTNRYSYSNRGYSRCGDVYSWRSYGCSYHSGNRPYYPDHAYYEDSYDRDAAIKYAFDTYREGKKYDYQIEKLRIQEEAKKHRYRYDWGYGYSGRIYNYGW